MSLLDFVFNESGYWVFEEPHHRKRVSVKIGYRTESNKTGEERANSVNLHFRLTTPSRREMEEFVEKWAEDSNNANLLSDLNGSPSDTKDDVYTRWGEFMMNFMDDMVQNYLITKSQSANNNGAYQMGYRPHNIIDTIRISLFVGYMQISYNELGSVVNKWLREYLK